MPMIPTDNPERNVVEDAVAAGAVAEPCRSCLCFGEGAQPQAKLLGHGSRDR